MTEDGGRLFMLGMVALAIHAEAKITFVRSDAEPALVNRKSVMGVILDFRELTVYQLAYETASQIYPLTQTFPTEERYSLVDQMRRSSRSVCANIAEAWRKRRYPASFVNKLSHADAEAAETTVWLDFAFDHDFIDDDAHTTLRDRYDHIQRQLSRMMGHPGQWCSPPGRTNRKE